MTSGEAIARAGRAANTPTLTEPARGWPSQTDRIVRGGCEKRAGEALGRLPRSVEMNFGPCGRRSVACGARRGSSQGRIHAVEVLAKCDAGGIQTHRALELVSSRGEVAELSQRGAQVVARLRIVTAEFECQAILGIASATGRGEQRHRESAARCHRRDAAPPPCSHGAPPRRSGEQHERVAGDALRLRVLGIRAQCALGAGHAVVRHTPERLDVPQLSGRRDVAEVALAHRSPPPSPSSRALRQGTGFRRGRGARAVRRAAASCERVSHARGGVLQHGPVVTIDPGAARQLTQPARARGTRRAGRPGD